MGSSRVKLLLLGAAALMAFVACGSSQQPLACTTIGCSSGANVNLAARPLLPGTGTTVTLCVDAVCTTRAPQSVPLDGIEIDVPFNHERTATVSITIAGPGAKIEAKDSIVATFHRVQPNGPKCPPVCFVADLTLTANGRLEPR